MTLARRTRKPRPADMYDGLALPKRRAVPEEPMDTSALAQRKIHPTRDDDYKAWLRMQPCAIKGLTDAETGQVHGCWSLQESMFGRPLSDPAHSGKAYSGKLKRDDRECIPLCRAAHNCQEDNHARFDRRYGINRFEIAREHFARFEKERRNG